MTTFRSRSGHSCAGPATYYAAILHVILALLIVSAGSPVAHCFSPTGAAYTASRPSSFHAIVPSPRPRPPPGHGDVGLPSFAAELRHPRTRPPGHGDVGLPSPFADGLRNPPAASQTKSSTPRFIRLRAGSSSSSSVVSQEESEYPNLPSRSFGGINYYGVDDTDDSGMKRRIYRTIFILGGPGAGKGTQSNLILETYPAPGRYVCHLSAGDLLRDARASGGDDAELIESYIVAGKIVPVAVTLGLLKKAMDQVCDESEGSSGSGSSAPPIFLIDGFPRSDANLDGWEELMGQSSALLATICYDCPEEELERRILERAKTSGRSDDNIESIRKRFHTFETETEPVVLRLEASRRCPVIHVDADRSIEEVWVDTKSVLDEVIASDVLSSNAALLSPGDKDVEGAEIRLLEGGKRAVVTYETTSIVMGRVREMREWSYGSEEDRGWANVVMERVPIHED